MNGVDGPVNMGSGQVYRIRDVVDTLAELTGMSGRIEWDTSKPNGQGYRAYDLSKIDSSRTETGLLASRGAERDVGLVLCAPRLARRRSIARLPQRRRSLIERRRRGALGRAPQALGRPGRFAAMGRDRIRLGSRQLRRAADVRGRAAARGAEARHGAGAPDLCLFACGVARLAARRKGCARLKPPIGSSTAITAPTAIMAGSFPFIPTAPSTTPSAIFTLIPSHCSASRGLTSSRPSHGFCPWRSTRLSVLDQHFEVADRRLSQRSAR